MSSCIFWKFRNTKNENFSRVMFNGPKISVFQLKKAIVEQALTKIKEDFDLQLMDAQSGEEYTDNLTTIPRNAAVVVKRVPANINWVRKHPISLLSSSSSLDDGVIIANNNNNNNAKEEEKKKNEYKYSDENHRNKDVEEYGGNKQSSRSLDIVQQINDAVGPPIFENKVKRQIEERKRQATTNTASISFSTATTTVVKEEKENDNIKKENVKNLREGGRRSGDGDDLVINNHNNNNIRHPLKDANKPTPPGYICHRCNQPGHWIQHCPTNGNPAYNRKTNNNFFEQGIISSSSVNKKDWSSSSLSPEQQQMVTVALKTQTQLKSHHESDGDATVINDVAKRFHSKSHDNNKGMSQSSMSKYECGLCNKMLKNATQTNCCNTVYCEECILNYLRTHFFQCPKCNQPCDPEWLCRNISLQSQVDIYIKKQQKSKSGHFNSLSKPSSSIFTKRHLLDNGSDVATAVSSSIMNNKQALHISQSSSPYAKSPSSPPPSEVHNTSTIKIEEKEKKIVEMSSSSSSLFQSYRKTNEFHEHNQEDRCMYCHGIGHLWKNCEKRKREMMESKKIDDTAQKILNNNSFPVFSSQPQQQTPFLTQNNLLGYNVNPIPVQNFTCMVPSQLSVPPPRFVANNRPIATTTMQLSYSPVSLPSLSPPVDPMLTSNSPISANSSPDVKSLTSEESIANSPSPFPKIAFGETQTEYVLRCWNEHQKQNNTIKRKTHYENGNKNEDTEENEDKKSCCHHCHC